MKQFIWMFEKTGGKPDMMLILFHIYGSSETAWDPWMCL